MTRKMTKPHAGSDFERFLTEEGPLQEYTAFAVELARSVRVALSA